MKRKRGSAKRQPKKDAKAAGVSVDPEYYSDANGKNDGNGSAARTKANEVNTEANSQPLGLDKPAGNDGTVGSAAAKLARAISTSHTNVVNDRAPLFRERLGFKEPKSSVNPLYNKQELDAAQLVVKKIMKMDAAAPFNAPVDPIALGIPDYFDIINTPMDFGTIAGKLEKGLEYKNSEDVFKDVQKVWDNCIKYNKKGSYILELMKRVKANFMKQWTAAGLCKEKQIVSDGSPLHSPPPANSTIKDDEAPDVYPGGPNINSSAYMQRHDSHFLNQRQHQTLSPYGPPTFNPQHIPYQWPGPYPRGQFPPGYHPHGMPPPYNYFTHPHMSGNQTLNEMSPNMMPSYQPPPSYSHMGHPHSGNWMQQPSSSHVVPSGLQSCINDHTAGHLRAPHRDSTSIRNKHEHAFNSGKNAGAHLLEDSIHIQDQRPSTSCKPGQQLNSSTHHQFQSPRPEVARYTDYAGNIHLLPPTESTVNHAKRRSDCPQPPETDNTRFRSHAQIDSSPEQSSSMVNVEACRETAADNNFSERKIQALRIIERQEHSSSSRNSHESQPQQISCRNQIDSLELRSSLPYYNTRPPKKRGRGPTRELQLREGERISVTINELGQPVGTEAQKLVTYLGTLARNGNFLPLTYPDWRAIPFETKESMWEKVESKFEISPLGKDWVMRNLGTRWKDWKSKLKIARYDTHKTDEERLADCDERVIPEQWAALVALWNTDEAQKRSARNRANRMKMKYKHATGSKSFARLREEQRAKRPDGKDLTRAELFVMTRIKKNGEPVNEETSKVIMQLREKDQDTPKDGIKAGDVLAEIIGPDKKGRPRCIELGPAPDDMQRPTRTEAIKMVSEAKSEIKEMKEKMATMEQTCSQMASQMAAMMSMMADMRKIVYDKNMPLIANNASGASEHSLPLQELTRPSPSVGSTRQTRQSSKRLL